MTHYHVCTRRDTARQQLLNKVGHFQSSASAELYANGMKHAYKTFGYDARYANAVITVEPCRLPSAECERSIH